MSQSLYERLGGESGITAISRDIIDNHLKNPEVKVRFQDVDSDKLLQYAIEFFSMGTGGPQKYTGREMREAHRSMNISGDEFISVLDDIMAAMDKHEVDTSTKNEVLGILYSLKNDIVRL